MQASTIIQFLRFVIIVVAMTCIFGIALDMVTAHLWVDYFTVKHPKVLESQSPIVMALYWGVAASWWFGAIAAAILWFYNRRRPRPVPEGMLIGWVARALVVLWVAMMAILGTIYALIGLLPANARRPTFDTDRRAMAVALTHMSEYVLGAVVLAVLMILVARWSKRTLQSDTAGSHHYGP